VITVSRTTVLGAAFVVAVLAIQPASAVLKSYDVRHGFVAESGIVSPSFLARDGVGRAVIGQNGSSPVLKKLLVIRDESFTIDAREQRFAFLSYKVEEGPTGEFTGTGGPASSIAWGALTGWTISGSIFCHSVPLNVCNFLGFPNDGTVDPVLRSSFYDLGTWIFHGTGFTATPFVHETFNDSLSVNGQFLLRGVLVLDGTVPAVPAVGLAVLSGSLVLGSLAALRRGKG
jgi:hypothetical protein